MTIYVDGNFKCYLDPASDRSPVSDPIIDRSFANKCRTFVQGYLYVPRDKKMVASDGTAYVGPMLTPWMPYDFLIEVQRDYDNQRVITENQLAESYREGVNSV